MNIGYRLYFSRIIIFLLLIFSSATIESQNLVKAVKGIFESPNKDNKKSFNPADLYDLTLDANLMNPSTGKYSAQIKAYQKKQAISIKRDHYKTELARDGEVIIVSIPVEDLFQPSDTVITNRGSNILRQFTHFLKDTDFYRMVIVMHSDNTGTNKYTYELSKNRVENVLNWFDGSGTNIDYLIPYAMGSSMPIVDNNSMHNRNLNRRLEIYLVPGMEMINQAKKGLLHF
ncbi:MAG: OmpA family protein [Muribaculaceae bacterium]|nr:OmpA family protein [Muribaculaceae bacterium]